MNQQSLFICGCILNLFYIISGLSVEFKTFNVCPQSYGLLITEKTNILSLVRCAVFCTGRAVCLSIIYDESSRICSLNFQMMVDPQDSDGCSLKVMYAEKPLCNEGSSCTYPYENTRLCDGAYPGQCDPAKGRLEVFMSGQWGTVCDDHWDTGCVDLNCPNALVTCRMYGFANGTKASGAFYGQGTGSIHLDNVICAGTENSIFECPVDAVGLNNCGHHEDVGVTCF